MQVIDNRVEKVYIAFDELELGDAFQDSDGDICIKTEAFSAIYWTGDRWTEHPTFSSDELIIPLEITYLIGRKEQE